VKPARVLGLFCNRSPWWKRFAMVDCASVEVAVSAINQTNDLVKQCQQALRNKDVALDRVTANLTRVNAAYVEELAKRVGLEDYKRQSEQLARLYGERKSEHDLLLEERNAFKTTLLEIAEMSGAAGRDLARIAQWAIDDQVAKRLAQPSTGETNHG
jgi:flagellar motility protein MotE (MotC chaperone)